LKIATWNVNSLRVRLPQVLEWIGVHQPDIFALQETKLPDTDFPVEAFQQIGYQATFSGQRTYNGVAILSRQPGSEMVTDIPGLEDVQRRVLGMTFANIRVFNFYVPNGESVTSEKYAYKLNWLAKCHDYLQAQLKQYPEMILLGDFNIAPEERDVYDPKQWEGQVLFSGPERQAFQAILQLGFQDGFRLLHPDAQEFSWWDYRLNAFKRNMGLRIDHILVSQALAVKCQKCFIDKSLRQAERPSDHAVVVMEIE